MKNLGKRLPLFILCSLLLAGTLTLDARRRRTGPARVVPEVAKDVTAPDTIAVGPQTVRISGYDKPNAATSESFFCTNLLPDSVTLSGVVLTFVYSDMSGRQLHERTCTVACDIPPGQTRKLSVRSWDANHAFHFFRSPAPVRRQSTRYQVRALPRKAIVYRH